VNNSRQLLISGIRVLLLIVVVGALLLTFLRIGLPAGAVTFTQSSADLDTYDFMEVSAHVSAARVRNPFTDATIAGTFQKGEQRWQVEGFSDAVDGSVYRVRFMPQAAGDYSYSVELRQGLSRRKFAGKFHARASSRRGPIRVDPQNRWHFIWEGTGEHYFFNGTTAYWLIGWRDDQVIQASLERLHRLKINRLRVTIAGRTSLYYGEPVMAGTNWTPFITPWQSNPGRFGRADDIYFPGFDYGRFQVSYWQKFERALRYARDRDMIFSLVLDMNDSRVHPAPGSNDEHRFIRYAIARFAAFSNITWDLGDDLDQYRDDAWTHTTGTLIKQWDPYQHLASSHPVDNVHQDRTSPWFDFTSFQEWSRTQHAFMLGQRKRQQSLGRIIPQTNEEYGYEDHYPMWAKGLGSESADTLRRTAWEIVMAGGYQTAGETARRGTNVWPDTGGGWMNGRGDETMTMFQGYAHMVDFFTAFEWWTTEPHDELVNNGNYCLAKPGELYAIYLPHGGNVTVQPQPGKYKGVWWNAVTGQTTNLPQLKVATASWTSPEVDTSNDWALLLTRLSEP
jgi:Domain of unknown function (DUF5060)